METIPPAVAEPQVSNLENPHAKFSEKVDQIIPAFIEMKSELVAAEKNAENPHFKSTYANLEAVDQACAAPFKKHGFTIMQPTFEDDGKLYVRTILLHKSCQWFACVWPIVAERGGPQSLGSGQTYARRFSWIALLGMVTSEELKDDDGNEAAKKIPQTKPPAKPAASKPPAKAAPEKVLTEIEKARRALFATAADTGYPESELKAMCIEQFKVKSRNDLTIDQIKTLIREMKKHPRPKTELEHVPF